MSSGLPLKADIALCSRHFAFVPHPDFGLWPGYNRLRKSNKEVSPGSRPRNISARLESGYRYATPIVGITPYAAGQVQAIALPAYGETASSGSPQFALNFASQTATATRGELGSWFDKSIALDRYRSLRKSWISSTITTGPLIRTLLIRETKVAQGPSRGFPN
jgi:Autotransporter beta-domain